MKLIKLDGCKTLTVTFILFMFFIFYHNLMNRSFGHHFNEELIKAESPESSANKAENDLTTSKRTKRFLIFQGAGVVKVSCEVFKHKSDCNKIFVFILKFC